MCLQNSSKSKISRSFAVSITSIRFCRISGLLYSASNSCGIMFNSPSSPSLLLSLCMGPINKKIITMLQVDYIYTVYIYNMVFINYRSQEYIAYKMVAIVVLGVRLKWEINCLFHLHQILLSFEMVLAMFLLPLQ